jgi:cytoskeleton protein RodZ
MSKEKKQATNTQVVDKIETSTIVNENSPGKQLVRAREALGLTQQQVADKLHLRINSVKSVEEDALEKGVSVTFNKGYVRLYAKLVRLEVQPLLDDYDKLHALDKQPAKLQSFSRRVSREADDHRWNMVTIVVIVLVVGSVIGWWVQRPDSLDNSQSFVSQTIDNLFSEEQNEASNTNTLNDKQDAQGDSQIVTSDSSLLSDQNTDTVEDIVTLDDTDLDIEGLEFNQTSEIDNQVIGAETDNQSLSATSERLATANTDANQFDEMTVEDGLNEADLIGQGNDDQGEQTTDTAADTIVSLSSINDGLILNEDGSVDMVFTFADDCWVSVTDANENVIAIGVKVAGRVMEVSGLPPLRIILGAPKSVEINAGSKDVDMSIFPSSRTANFILALEGE